VGRPDDEGLQLTADAPPNARRKADPIIPEAPLYRQCVSLRAGWSQWLVRCPGHGPRRSEDASTATPALRGTHARGPRADHYLAPAARRTRSRPGPVVVRRLTPRWSSAVSTTPSGRDRNHNPRPGRRNHPRPAVVSHYHRAPLSSTQAPRRLPQPAHTAPPLLRAVRPFPGPPPDPRLPDRSPPSQPRHRAASTHDQRSDPISSSPRAPHKTVTGRPYHRETPGHSLLIPNSDQLHIGTVVQELTRAVINRTITVSLNHGLTIWVVRGDPGLGLSAAVSSGSSRFDGQKLRFRVIAW
jgi:hypothetical protein